MGGWWDLMWASEKGKLPPGWRAGVAPSWSPPISHFEARSARGKMAPSCLHYPCSLPASLAQPHRGKCSWRKTSLPLLKTPGVAQTSRSAFGWIPFIIQERPSASSWTCYLSMLMIRHVLILNLCGPTRYQGPDLCELPLTTWCSHFSPWSLRGHTSGYKQLNHTYLVLWEPCCLSFSPPKRRGLQGHCLLQLEGQAACF